MNPVLLIVGFIVGTLIGLVVLLFVIMAFAKIMDLGFDLMDARNHRRRMGGKRG